MKTNPILNFRKREINKKSLVKKETRKKSEKKSELQTTSITKTREAIDSTEITSIYESL